MNWRDDDEEQWHEIYRDETFGDGRGEDVLTQFGLNCYLLLANAVVTPSVRGIVDHVHWHDMFQFDAGFEIFLLISSKATGLFLSSLSCPLIILLSLLMTLR